MFNIYNYCNINWEATSNNIKSLLKIKQIPIPVFAKAMCVTERTVYNWCNGKEYGKPKLQELVMMALIFKVDMLDIIIIDGRMCKTIYRDDIEEMLVYQENKKELKCEEPEVEYGMEEDVIVELMINELYEKNYAIRNLEEFLLYLPLMDFNRLKNFLGRVDGNIGTHRHYVMEQLNYLYESIQNREAKHFADWYKIFYLTYPKIQDIDCGNQYSVKQEKIKKWEAAINDYKVWEKQCDAYDNEHEKFLEKLTSVYKTNDPA